MASPQTQLQNKSLTEDEARQLYNALAQYDDRLQRRRPDQCRSALEATLIAMPDKMEEVYQPRHHAPTRRHGRQTEESPARLRIAEKRTPSSAATAFALQPAGVAGTRAKAATRSKAHKI
ncbi:MAG: hypothetical protein IPH35_26970 [Rhodoferax sp.]|nr:hypothetical protein [Rhodoferax sp.]